jgi:carboxypeptidase Taq
MALAGTANRRAIQAAQAARTRAEAELGPLEEQFAAGDYAPLLTWLRARIHSQGHRLWARPLVREVTGEELTPQYLVRYLQRKFGTLYGFPAADF